MLIAAVPFAPSALEYITTFGRVGGVLAVSRSFGDHDPAWGRFVIADPYTRVVELRDPPGTSPMAAANPFFIVACDGVWDVMQDQHAMELVLYAMGLAPRPGERTKERRKEGKKGIEYQ